jgi:hypothetical protein
MGKKISKLKKESVPNTNKKLIIKWIKAFQEIWIGIKAYTKV